MQKATCQKVVSHRRPPPPRSIFGPETAAFGRKTRLLGVSGYYVTRKNRTTAVGALQNVATKSLPVSLNLGRGGKPVVSRRAKRTSRRSRGRFVTDDFSSNRRGAREVQSTSRVCPVSYTVRFDKLQFRLRHDNIASSQILLARCQ